MPRPEGDPAEPVAEVQRFEPVSDPGGDVQSFGYFMTQMDFGRDPSDPDTRDGRGFPGFDCNPNNVGGH